MTPGPPYELTCPHCGGIFDPSITVCPIDGYDYSRVLEEQARREKRKKAKRRLKYIALAVLALTIIIAIFSIITGARASGGKELGRRLNHLSSEVDRFGTTKNRLLTPDRFSVLVKRVDQIGESITAKEDDGSPIRLQTARIRLTNVNPFYTTQGRIGYIKSVHGPENTIRLRWIYALDKAEETLGKLRSA